MNARIVFCILISFVLRSSAQAQWTKVFGPAGGDVEAIASDAGHVYAGTDSGVYVSNNNGDTWTQELTDLTDSEIFSLAVTPNGTILAGTEGGGISRSTDFGTSWSGANTGIPSGSNILSVASDGHGNIFAGHSTEGVFYSSDDGLSWTARNSSMENAAIFSLTVAPDGTVYAGSKQFIFSSTDEGEHWDTSENVGLSFDEVLALAADSSGNIFAGTLQSGRLWLPVGTTQWQSTTPVAVSSDEQVHALAAVSGRVFMGMFGAGIEQTGDLGSTWTNFSGGLTDLHVYALTVAPSGSLFAGTFLGEVFRANLGLSVGRERSSGSDLAIWPQPFGNRASISFRLDRAEPVRLVVLDALGREVESVDGGTMSSGACNLTFDASRIPNGACYILLRTPSKDLGVPGLCLH